MFEMKENDKQTDLIEEGENVEEMGLNYSSSTKSLF